MYDLNHINDKRDIISNTKLNDQIIMISINKII